MLQDFSTGRSNFMNRSVPFQHCFVTSAEICKFSRNVPFHRPLTAWSHSDSTNCTTLVLSLTPLFRETSAPSGTLLSLKLVFDDHGSAQGFTKKPPLHVWLLPPHDELATGWAPMSAGTCRSPQPFGPRPALTAKIQVSVWA